MSLLRLSDLSGSEVRKIWDLVASSPTQLSGTVAWSFEGSGIRTRFPVYDAQKRSGNPDPAINEA